VFVASDAALIGADGIAFAARSEMGAAKMASSPILTCRTPSTTLGG